MSKVYDVDGLLDGWDDRGDNEEHNATKDRDSDDEEEVHVVRRAEQWRNHLRRGLRKLADLTDETKKQKPNYTVPSVWNEITKVEKQIAVYRPPLTTAKPNSEATHDPETKKKQLWRFPEYSDLKRRCQRRCMGLRRIRKTCGR